MKNRINIKMMLIALVVLSTNLWSQTVYSEAPIFLENGVVMSDRFTVAFKENVIPTQAGEVEIPLTRVDQTYSDVALTLSQFSDVYGDITLIKKLPAAVWGDTVKTNVHSGETVVIPDMSQIFSVKFSEPVPIDSLINVFESLDVVKYADQPVQMIDLIDPPNDPLYADAGNRWYLDRIQALDAWGITTGDPSVKVAIMESNGVNIYHEDIDEKFIGGEYTTGDGAHGRSVASICAAQTNNDTGMAALGWNLSLLAYTSGVGEAVIQTGGLADDISLAAASGARVINMSFHTTKVQSGKYCP